MCVFNSSRTKRWVFLLVAAHANKTWRYEPNKYEDGDPFPKHKHLTPVTVLAMHMAASQYIFKNLCKPIAIYIYARKQHPFTSYPTAKHPKHNKLAVTDIREKPVNTAQTSTLAPAIIL